LGILGGMQATINNLVFLVNSAKDIIGDDFVWSVCAAGKDQFKMCNAALLMGGFARVGPKSSGADPGPACYGLGGREPTITDANVVLGRVKNLLGGQIKLDREKAAEAIRLKLADPLNLELLRAAEGILEIAVSKIVDIMRAVSVFKGIDIRDFVMFAFGGAGPMHSAFIAGELNLATVVIPPSPGTFSALGFLCSDLRHDFVKTRIMDVRELPVSEIQVIFHALESQAQESLRQEGADHQDAVLLKSVDMRYVGQAHEINIPFQFDCVSTSVPQALAERFHQHYERTYGHASPEEAVEMVNFRVTAVGKVKKPTLIKKALKKNRLNIKRKRDVYFNETGWVNCPVYDRKDLSHGVAIKGPAIIEEYSATTVIPPDVRADIDAYENIILRLF